MDIFQRAILTHGGAGSNPQNSDGPQAAAKLGMNVMKNGKSALDAVVHAVEYLEDDPRFNAGTGSQIRADGRTVQMDASCMTSNGQFGAVACVEGIRHPIDLAKEILLHSPHIIMAGQGALFFAEKQNIPVMQLIDYSEQNNEQTIAEKNRPPSCDTVGAVAFDGAGFAAALSSGGLKNTAVGRVGDVPLPGCGLFCGPEGAVACTGDGEFIALKILAREIYGWLEQKMPADEAVEKALTLFDDSVDIGLIIVTEDNFAANSRNGMAWSHTELIK